MIIDCHQHTNWHGRRTTDLIAYLDSAGVDKAWLLSWESLDGARDPWYMYISIEDVFEASRQYPGRFVIGAGVDPRRERATDLLREFHAAGARVYGEIKVRMLMDTPDLVAMFRTAGELGMPALFHLQLPQWDAPTPGQWYLGDIDAVERTLQRCPHTNFLGHAQGWWANISGDNLGYVDSYPKGPIVPGGGVQRLLDKYPNLYCDLSAGSGLNAMTRDPQVGRKFLLNYADRLCYGTDFWDTRMLDHLRSLHLPADVQEKIFWRNAERLVRT